MEEKQMKRALTNLRKAKKGDIYVYLRNKEIGSRFLLDAEHEGFTIGADRPTEKPYATIMALRDRTISYVGFVGAVRFQCGDTRKFHRVDYEKYICGAKKYKY
jgi:hypothetical protein